MKFKLKLEDSKLFKNAFEAVSVIVDELQIQIDTEGLRCSALDRSHITFCNLELKANLFDEFHCDEPVELNVDTLELMNVLKRIKNNDVLECSMDEGNLIFVFYGEATRRFRTRLIDIEYDCPTPPNVQVPCVVNMPSNIMREAVNDMAIYSDKLEFIVDENNFIVSAGDDFGDCECKFLHGEEINKEVKSIFGLEKIKDIMKSSKFSKTIQIGLGNDMPVKLDFILPTGEGKIGFMLAPRLSEE